jgi:eukaryotic-like serine/threonine-protein kinase
MPSIVILSVVKGSLKAERFLCRAPARVLVGRSTGCEVRLPNDPLHWNVSRRHCLITAVGTKATIRDLGSRNSTYVNGKKIGQRASAVPADEALAAFSPPLRLRAGDEVQVGETIFHVEIRQAAPGTEDAVETQPCEPALVG